MSKTPKRIFARAIVKLSPPTSVKKRVAPKTTKAMAAAETYVSLPFTRIMGDKIKNVATITSGGKQYIVPLDTIRREGSVTCQWDDCAGNASGYIAFTTSIAKNVFGVSAP